MLVDNNDFNPNQGENTPISDTGSGVFEPNQDGTEGNYGENQENNGDFPKKQEISSETEENPRKHGNFFTEEGVSQLKRDFPAVDPEKLSKSENFQAFLSVIKENPTLSEIYSAFNAISASIEEKAREKALYSLASSSATPGALSSGESSDTVYYTRAQVLEMSREEIRKNLDIIRQSQAKW